MIINGKTTSAIPVFSFINIMFFYTNMEGGNIRIIPIKQTVIEHQQQPFIFHFYDLFLTENPHIHGCRGWRRRGRQRHS